MRTETKKETGWLWEVVELHGACGMGLHGSMGLQVTGSIWYKEDGHKAVDCEAVAVNVVSSICPSFY